MPKSVSVRSGQVEFLKLNLQRREYRDIYQWLLALKWPEFAALIAGIYIILNLVFAEFYALGGGSIAGLRSGSYVDAFFFSVQTLATVGDGHWYPQTLNGHILTTIEIIVGMFGLAVMTGLIFVRFSRPAARILFSKAIVIGSLNGRPTLMLRVGNLRAQSMVEFALVLPMLLLLVVGIIELGYALFVYVEVQSAGREGARAAAVRACPNLTNYQEIANLTLNGANAVAIAVGYFHTVTLLADGSLRTFGASNTGQAGTPTGVDGFGAFPSPIRPAGVDSVTAVAATAAPSAGATPARDGSAMAHRGAPSPRACPATSAWTASSRSRPASGTRWSSCGTVPWAASAATSSDSARRVRDTSRSSCRRPFRA